MNLLNLCETSGMLRAVYIVKLILSIIFILLPLIVIITTSISFTKVLIDGKSDSLKEITFTSIKKIIAALIVFIIPSIINYTFENLLDANNQFASCWAEATLDNILKKEKLEEEERIRKREEYKKQLAEVLEEQAALEKAKNEVLKQQREEYNTGGNLEGEVLTSGTSGTYFAPFQGGTHRISGASLTGGCSNTEEVYHDISSSVGTPVYAPYDGKATYIQSNCNGYISSYGNQVRVYKDDGTYIIYAHFSKFAEGIEMPLTKDCKDSNSPTKCGAGHCTVGMTSTKVAEVTVKKGQLIGYTGNSGNSEGPHLHVEIHEGGGRTCVTDPWAKFGMR